MNSRIIPAKRTFVDEQGKEQIRPKKPVYDFAALQEVMRVWAKS